MTEKEFSMLTDMIKKNELENKEEFAKLSTQIKEMTAEINRKFAELFTDRNKHDARLIKVEIATDGNLKDINRLGEKVSLMEPIVQKMKFQTGLMWAGIGLAITAVAIPIAMRILNK